MPQQKYAQDFGNAARWVASIRSMVMKPFQKQTCLAKLKELERRLSELPRDQQIVAHCRGPYCVLAVKTVILKDNR